MNFISSSVVNGFIQSAAFSIPLGQFKNLFGVQSNREGFIGQIIDLFEELLAGKANWYDFGMGMGSLVLLILLGKLKVHRIVFEKKAIRLVKARKFLEISKKSSKVNDSHACRTNHVFRIL